MKKLPLIGIASGLGAGHKGCHFGPQHLKSSALFQQTLNNKIEWQAMVTSDVNTPLEKVVATISKISNEVAQATEALVKQHRPFVAIGGDHSSAIGTWSGASAALKPQKKLGLLWLDAHLDAHTFETSVSGNVHGMPVAALLGYGDQQLTQVAGFVPKLLPENIVYLGVRSFETQERELLARLGVKIIFMDEITRVGFEKTLENALSYLHSHCDVWGISLDIDSLDPADAPGTGAPEAGGLRIKEVMQLFKQTDFQNCIGVEISEFDPARDIEQKTEKFIIQFLDALTGKFCD